MKNSNKAEKNPNIKIGRGRHATMQKLIRIGLKIFSEVGFNGATTRMISQRSGVNEALIMRYFESKSGLFLAVIQDFIEKAKENEEQYEHGLTVEKEIENYLNFKLNYTFDSREFLRMCVSRVAIDSKIRKQVEKLVMCTIYAENSILERRLRLLIKQGLIRKDVDIRVTLRVIQALDDGMKFRMLVTSHFELKEAQEQIRLFAEEFGRSLSC
jgi:AcrR family transcriptional regulator